MSEPRPFPYLCENEQCRNLLPDPPPLLLRKRYLDSGGRVRTVLLAFCTWHCVEVVAARAKNYAAEEAGA